MESVEERFNRIKKNVQEVQNRQASVNERFNRIKNQIDTQRQIANQQAQKRASVNPMLNVRNQFNTFKTNYSDIKKQTDAERERKRKEDEEKLKQAKARAMEEASKSKNGIQMRSLPTSNEIHPKQESTTGKIQDAYRTTFGPGGFAGINNMVNEAKRTPEVLKAIKDTSVESPTVMGLRGTVANTVDAITTETASLLEEPEEKTPLDYIPIYRTGRTAKRVFDTARKISQNGGSTFDVVWGAGSTLVTDSVKNTLSSMPGATIGDLGKQGIRKVTSDNIDEETRKELQNRITGITKSYQEDYAKYKENEAKKSKIHQDIDNVLEGTSRMGGSIGTTFVTGNPNAGLFAMGLSAKGSATQQALKEGATLDQAIDIGNLSMLTEMVTEKIWSGIRLPGGKSLYGKALGDEIEDFILNRLKTKGGKWLASKGMDIAGEIAEEFISDTMESVAKRGIYDENAKLPTWEDYKNTAKITTGTTVLLNLLTGGFLQGPSNINTQNNTEYNKLIDTVENKYGNNSKEVVQEQAQKAFKEYAEKNNIQNLQQNPIKNQNTNQQQQITQIENKNDLNQNVEETKFSKILNNQELPMQSYVYEKSDNVKIDNLRQQANKYFNNSQEAHNFVDMLEKIIADKDVTINFDTNLGEDVNGSYYNGVITINPNSTRAGEFLAVHELTHAIGTDSMIKMVENYRKSNAEFDSQVQKLLKKYNQSEINEEALADIAGQLFGNQEYINNLATTNPSMFKRIYNEIKYLWHQFRGYKNQDQFVDDLMFKWEQAYRKNNQLNDTNRKSLVGESAVLADKDKLKQAQKMERSGMTADEIFKETGWYKGNEGKWRFELDDSNWNIKDIKNYNKEGTFKLEDILDAPELYKAYPELKDFTVHMRSNMEDSNFGALATDIFTGEKSIVLNSNKIRNSDMKSYEMLGLKNQSEIFSVLQHEIQHYIQNKEEFSQGASPGYWFDEKNKEFKNKISNVFGDKAELYKKYGFEKGNSIKFALDSISIQKSIIHNTQIELAELKAKNVKNENNQRMIDLDEHIIKDRNQLIDGNKDELKSYVSEKEIEKLNKVLAEYDNFLKKRT